MGQNHHKPKPKAGSFTVDYVPGRGFVVLDPQGYRVSGFHGSQDAALTVRDSKQQFHDAGARRGERACLCCGVRFVSEGIHNRLCTGCRSANSDTQPYQFINPRRRQG